MEMVSVIYQVCILLMHTTYICFFKQTNDSGFLHVSWSLTGISHLTLIKNLIGKYSDSYKNKFLNLWEVIPSFISKGQPSPHINLRLRTGTIRYIRYYHFFAQVGGYSVVEMLYLSVESWLTVGLYLRWPVNVSRKGKNISTILKILNN